MRTQGLGCQPGPGLCVSSWSPTPPVQYVCVRTCIVLKQPTKGFPLTQAPLQVSTKLWGLHASTWHSCLSCRRNTACRFHLPRARRKSSYIQILAAPEPAPGAPWGKDSVCSLGRGALAWPQRRRCPTLSADPIWSHLQRKQGQPFGKAIRQKNQKPKNCLCFGPLI